MAEINIEKMARNVAERAIQELRDNGIFIGRWIPVSERLPEELHSVLVYCPTTDNIYCAFLENGKWFVFYAEEQPQINEIVIAWMPLPKSYKGESEG